jgi:hypothetical protein
MPPNSKKLLKKMGKYIHKRGTKPKPSKAENKRE